MTQDFDDATVAHSTGSKTKKSNLRRASTAKKSRLVRDASRRVSISQFGVQPKQSGRRRSTDGEKAWNTESVQARIAAVLGQVAAEAQPDLDTGSAVSDWIQRFVK
jgi:hypothetical protein